MIKTTTRMHFATLLAAVLLISCSAAGAKPPTGEELEEKVVRFVTWQRGTPAGELTDEAMQAKIEEIFGDVEFEELDMAGIQIVARFVPMSPELQQRLTARLQTIMKQPDAQGAAAAAMLVADAYGKGNAALARALRETFQHPGFGDAVRQGLATDTLRMLDYVPDEVLIELADPIVGLAPYFEAGDARLVADAGPSYVVTLNKLKEQVAPGVRERIRVMIHGHLVELASEETAESLVRYYEAQARFVDGRFARGELMNQDAPAITFTWSSNDGELTTLRDLKGKVVVLDFWATWCGPCIASFPSVAELRDRYDGYDVAIVGVTSLQGQHFPGSGDEPIDTSSRPELEYALMGDFMRVNRMTWIVAFSEQDVFNADFGVRSIPHLAIIDAAGKVRYNGLHPSATPLEEKSKKIDGLLREAGLSTPSPL